MGLKINKDDMDAAIVDEDWESAANEDVKVTGSSEFKTVYGDNVNMKYVHRDSYHSEPHTHTAEQINYILEGTVWWYVEDRAYLLEPGDFHRVPSGDVHWAKTAETPVKMVEAHSPPLIGDSREDGEDRPGTVGLYLEHEAGEPAEISVNESIDDKESYIAKEAQMEEEYFARQEQSNK